MMLTIRSFVSPVLPRTLSLTTMPRLLTTFTKNVLNTSRTPLLLENVSSLWVSYFIMITRTFICEKRLYSFPKNFVSSSAFSVYILKETFSFLSKKTDTVIPLLFICSFVRLSFIFQKVVN